MNLQIGCSNLGMGGTKLECSAVNVLLSVEKQQEEVSDYWVCTRQQQKGLTETFSFHNFQDFSVHKEEEKEKEKEEKEEEEEGVVMENTPLNTIATSSSSNTIEESIRKTMQRHEDIFQQQVRELHRLYSVQKTMMKEEVKKQQQQHQTRLLCWNQSTTTTSNWPPPPEEEVGNTVRNISSRDSIEEDEVELTLSIGGGQSMGGDPNNKMKPKRPHTSDHKSFNSSLSIESDRVGLDVPDSTGSATETSDKAKKRPFWLF